MRCNRNMNLLFSLSTIGLLVPLAQDARAAAPNGSWTRFEDPIERAFTLDVPQGWTARGGLFRLGLSDYRPMVDLKSPDGRTNIRLGDVSSLHIPYPIDFTRERETSWIWARRRR